MHSLAVAKGLTACLAVMLSLQHGIIVQAAPGDQNWDDRFGQPCDNAVYSVVASGSVVYVGGYFTTIGGITANRIAAWNGAAWSALGDGLNGPVYAIAVSENKVYVGGLFTQAGGREALNVAVWDGNDWSAVGTNAPAVNAMAVRGSEVFISHGVSNAVLGPYLARWNGTNWSSLGGGVTATIPGEPSTPVRSILVNGNNIYVGGQFTRVGGSVNATNIARWDGNQWSQVGGGIHYIVPYGRTTMPVSAMAFHGNDLFVCGNFTRAGAASITNIARWNGATWSAVGTQTWYFLYSIVPVGQDLYVGGYIDPVIDGGITKGITKWDGTQWTLLGSGVNGTIYSMAALERDVFVGGRFTAAGGHASTNFAAWHDAPQLRIEPLSARVRISWATQYTGFTLQASTNLLTNSWYNVSGTPGIYNGRYAVTNSVNRRSESFRLRQ